jgi:hypothetical protein
VFEECFGEGAFSRLSESTDTRVYSQSRELAALGFLRSCTVFSRVRAFPSNTRESRPFTSRSTFGVFSVAEPDPTLSNSRTLFLTHPLSLTNHLGSDPEANGFGKTSHPNAQGVRSRPANDAVPRARAKIESSLGLVPERSGNALAELIQRLQLPAKRSSDSCQSPTSKPPCSHFWKFYLMARNAR